MTYVRGGKIIDGPLCQHVTDPAFRFGVGFYETLLYNGHHLVNVQAHLSRITTSIQVFNLQYEPVDLHAATEMLLEHLNLRGSMARINLFYTLEHPAEQDGQNSTPSRPSLIPTVTAAPYTPPPADKEFTLVPARTAVCSPWHAHKTTNHMPHYLERIHAQESGFDDAILLLPDGTLLETTTAALLFFDGSTFIISNSTYRLQSTSELLASELLDITTAPTTLQSIKHCKHAYVLNSLMGMRPVRAVGGNTFTPDFATCDTVTSYIQNKK